ncbi:MAG: sigma-70 family RNA polymerase sigma factor [Verrucomicrobiales bacterium]|nr:sigma-70 family RNA polymerase sigma factor [Verrucomicrobiales bacterium]
MTEEPAIQEIADEALFSRIAGGDAAAFESFYDRYERLFFGLVLRILRDEKEAEDVLQDAAVLIWERAPQYHAALGRPLSWAVTLVRNKAIDRLRAGKRRGNLLERAAGEFATAEAALSPPTDPARVGIDGAEIVRRSLLGLPLEQRQAIELAFFGGLSQSEIADHLQQPLGTIKARIRRGMITLRDALEGAL